MDFDSIAKSIGAQFVTAWHAPIPFLAAVLLVGWVIWKIVQREFGVRLANADSTNTMLRERLQRSEISEALTAVSVHSQREEVAESHPTVVRSPAKAITKTGEREYLREGESLDNLMGVFEGRTDILAKRMLADQFGKWVVIEGPIADIADVYGDNALVILDAGNHRTIGCMFKSPPENLLGMGVGTTIKIEGKINSVAEYGVSLTDCELVA